MTIFVHNITNSKTVIYLIVEIAFLLKMFIENLLKIQCQLKKCKQADVYLLDEYPMRKMKI